MDAPEDPPTRIGNRYRLDERIGAGAMGAVWRGTDELLNRPVALKELLAAASRGGGAEGAEEARQRLMREGRIGARLQHAHVISMFDVVIHEERPWLVMEYLPSASLAQVLASKGPMEPREAADVGRQVADGLAAAHVAGVVHRDVKPGNVLIGEDGRVKLTDFGVSRAVDDVQLTRTGLIAGTPAFLAPEIARGHEPTAASDVFALGSTLYAAVEGVPPFGLDENAYALLHKVATGEVDPPTQAGVLEPVMMQLLAPDPADRPTAAQARDALAQVVAAPAQSEAPTVAASRRPSIRGAVGRGAATRGNGAKNDGAKAAGPGLAAAGAAGAGLGAAAGAAAATDGGPGTVASPPASGGDGTGAATGGPRRRWPILVAAAVLILLVGTGVVLSLQNTGGTTPPAAVEPTSAPETTEPAPSTSEPAPTTEAAPTPPPAAAPPTAAPAPDPGAVADPVGFMQGYYALLPDDTGTAFALLSPQAQAASGGRGGFDRFYGEMETVTLQDARQVGDNVVEGTVVFNRTNGTVTNEPYRFVLATVDGRTIMESFSQG